MDPDDLVVLGVRAVDHCHQAVENDIEIAGAITLAIEALATGGLSAIPVFRQHPNLALGQSGKGRVMVGRLRQLNEWILFDESVDACHSWSPVERHDPVT